MASTPMTDNRGAPSRNNRIAASEIDSELSRAILIQRLESRCSRVLRLAISSHPVDAIENLGRGAELPVHFAHALKDERAVVVHALGPPLQRSRQNRSQPCRLFPADAAGRGSVVVTTGRFRTINTRTPLDHVEVDLQNAPLPEEKFGHGHQREFRSLAQDRPARSEKQVLYELLGNGGSSASVTALHIVCGGNLNFVPIEPVMLVEARILRGDYR